MLKHELSLSTSIFFEDPLEEALKKTKETGYSSLEINGEEHTNGLVEGKYKIEETKRILRKLDLEVLSFHTFITEDFSFKKHKDYYHKLAEVAEKLEAKIIVDHMTIEDNGEVRSELKTLVELFSSKGIQYTIENLDKPGEFYLEIMNEVPGLAFTFDVCHSLNYKHIKEKKEPNIASLIEDFRPVAPYTVNLHLLGANPKFNRTLGDGLPPGTEVFSWKEFAHLLKSSNYNGQLTVELFPQGITQALLPVLLVMEKVLKEDEELALNPITYFDTLKNLPDGLLNLDTGKLRLSYKKNPDSSVRGFDELLAKYSREFFEKNLLSFLKKGH